MILNVREAAEYTRLKAATIYLYVQRRKIPFLKIGSRVLFEQSALEEWVAAHRVEPLERPRREAVEAGR